MSGGTPAGGGGAGGSGGVRCGGRSDPPGHGDRRAGSVGAGCWVCTSSCGGPPRVRRRRPCRRRDQEPKTPGATAPSNSHQALESAAGASSSVRRCGPGAGVQVLAAWAAKAVLQRTLTRRRRAAPSFSVRPRHALGQVIVLAAWQFHRPCGSCPTFVRPRRHFLICVEICSLVERSRAGWRLFRNIRA